MGDAKKDSSTKSNQDEVRPSWSWRFQAANPDNVLFQPGRFLPDCRSVSSSTVFNMDDPDVYRSRHSHTPEPR